MSEAEKRAWTESRWLPAAVAAFTALALALTELDREPLWFDEAYSAHLAERTPSEIIIEYVRTNREGPPLYLLLLHACMPWLGRSDVSVRLPSVAAATAAAALYALLFCRLLERRVAVLASLLAAASPVLLRYAQEARGYALTHALFALSLVLFVRYLDRRRAADLLALYLANALALLAQVLSLELLLVQGVIVLLMRPGRRTLVVWALSQLAYLPFLVPVLSLYGRVSQNVNWWIPETEWNGILNAFAMYTGTSFQENPFAANRGLDSLAAHLKMLLVAQTVLAVIATLRIVLRRAASRSPAATYPMIVPLVSIAAIGVPLLLSLALRPYFLPRFLIMGIPCFSALIAYGLSIVVRRGDLFVTAGILLVACRVDLCLLDLRILHKDDWRTAASVLEDQIGPDDTLIVCSGRGIVPLMRYYGGPVQPVPVKDTFGQSETASEVDRFIESIKNASSRLWVVFPWGGGGADTPNGFMMHLLGRTKAYRLAFNWRAPGSWGGVLILGFEMTGRRTAR